MKLRAISLLFLILPSVLRAAPDLLSDLTASQREEVLGGRQVVLMEEIEGKPWPRVRLYQKVDALPEEVAAVFFDYRNAKSYIPKVIKSDISRQISPCIAEVDYGVDVPILPDEFYTARNELTSGEDGSYCVSWSLVRALQTKASEGNLRIEKYGDGSVIRYTNLVTPGSSMAKILRIPAIDQMKNTVHAIVRHVEDERRQHPAELKARVEQLRQAVGAGGSQ